jgi:hypothetical protein
MPTRAVAASIKRKNNATTTHDELIRTFADRTAGNYAAVSSRINN